MELLSRVRYRTTTSANHCAVVGTNLNKGVHSFIPLKTYICRVQSSVWRLPPGGEGVNILEDARHWIGLLQCKSSTVHSFLDCLSERSLINLC